MKQLNLVSENVDTAKKLGVVLRRIRKQKGFSQFDLAKQINIRQSTISDVENGKGNIASLFKIIQALKINLAIADSGQFTSLLTKKQNKHKKLIDMLNNLDRMD